MHVLIKKNIIKSIEKDNEKSNHMTFQKYLLVRDRCLYRLLLCWFLCISIMPVFGTSYYLSNTGNDTNIGTTVKQPWQTIDRLNKQKLLPGDSVLFKCNDVFRGQIQIQFSGKEQKLIVYTSYGAGKLPVISGAIQVKNWEKYTDKIILSHLQSNVYSLYADNEMQINARYPNQGLLKFGNGYNCIEFTDTSLTQKDGYWTGATIRFRTFDWEFRTSKVVDFTTKKITIQDSSTNTLSKGWGYYFDNKFEELDTLKEWYFNKNTHTLYFIPERKHFPNKTIEASIYTTGIIINENVQNIVIQNLKIEKYEDFGILGKSNNAGIKISNNQFENINRTAIELSLLSKKCLIENNLITNVNGRGISANEPEHLIVRGNTIRKIGNIPGYGISGVNGMIGIVIENNESEKEKDAHIAIGNLIQYNIVDSVGYVGIRMDGTKSIMEKNVVSNSLIKLSDGSAIYCWAKSKFYTHDNIIRDNIVYNVTGNNTGTPSENSPIANAIYIDNKCYNITIEGNVVFNSTGSGILINSEAYDNLISGNIVYDCKSGLRIDEWSIPNTTFGNIFEDNVVFAKKTQSCVVLANWLIPSTKNLGSFNHNTYVKISEKYLMSEHYLADDKITKISNNYSFENWKSHFGFDKNSRASESKDFISKYKLSKLFFNSSLENEKIDVIDQQYVDLNGKPVSILLLKPFTAAILLFNEK